MFTDYQKGDTELIIKITNNCFKELFIIGELFVIVFSRLMNLILKVSQTSESDYFILKEIFDLSCWLLRQLFENSK